MRQSFLQKAFRGKALKLNNFWKYSKIKGTLVFKVPFIIDIKEKTLHNLYLSNVINVRLISYFVLKGFVRGIFVEYFNVHQALKILQEYYITDSIQMVTRWIREGKIKAVRSENRKEGWQIHRDDLFEFIEEKRPGLPEVKEVYDWFVKNSFSLQLSESNGNIEIPSNNTEDMETNSLEKDRNQLYDIKQLEDQIKNIQEELHLTYEQFVDMSTVVQELKEENESLRELYEQLHEIYQEIEKKMNDQTIKKVNKTKNRNIIKSYSLKKFEELVIEVMNEYDDSKSLLEKQENIVNEMYNLFFHDNENLNEEIIVDEQYTCPLTKKEYKNLKPLLKNAIKYKIKQELKTNV